MKSRKTDDGVNGSSQAIVYRMVMSEHRCPFGLKTKALLERKGFDVDDRWLTSREAVDAFKAEQDVETTPQTFIEGKRIGGYDEVRRYFGKSVKGKDETTYQPVIAIFSVAALLALAISWTVYENIFTIRAFEWFIAVSMTLLGIQKLQDVESFSTMFLNYDLLAQRQVSYAYLYPFGETLAGILMISGTLIWIAAPVALFIGSVGTLSVFKAVYIDKRELKCACVGGNSNVPLGFLSLTENLMMLVMGLWMPVRMIMG